VFIDVPELIERSARSNTALDLRSWGRKSGLVAGSPAAVADAVADSLAHPDRLSAVRCQIAADLFYNPGRATHAAMDWLSRHFLAGTGAVRARRLAS
jgi:hypothetical protein